MPTGVHGLVLTIFVLASSIWVGGYVTIVVVARASTQTMDEGTRVQFFKALGRLYFWVGTPALVVALGTGAALAHDRWSSGLFIASAILAALLIVLFAIAVAQARRITRLRQRLAEPGAPETLSAQVRGEAARAGMLRGILGLLTIIIVVLGAFLAIA